MSAVPSRKTIDQGRSDGDRDGRAELDGAGGAQAGLPGDGVGPDLLARFRRLEEENAQLRQALVSRVVIEQAKGILAERHHLELDEAFELVRRTARSRRMRLHLLASAVIEARNAPNGLETDGKTLRLGAAVRADGRPERVA